MLVFKHVLNPRQKGGMGSPFSIVTDLVDQSDLNGSIVPTADIKMSGAFAPCVCYGLASMVLFVLTANTKILSKRMWPHSFS